MVRIKCLESRAFYCWRKWLAERECNWFLDVFLCGRWYNIKDYIEIEIDI